jgi:hypothetical protein
MMGVDAFMVDADLSLSLYRPNRLLISLMQRMAFRC